MAHGETHLDTLVKTMQPILHEDVFVFHSSDISMRDAAALDPVLMFREAEGTALILKQETADKHGLPYVSPSQMITLNVYSSLEAVGFLAAITKSLAQENISVNAVSAHFHDHLFVPESRSNDAMGILKRMIVGEENV